MKKIFLQQKFILTILAVVFLQLLFSSGKNTALAEANCTSKNNGKKVEITYKKYDGAGFFCGTDWTKNGFIYSYKRIPDNSGCANGKCDSSKKVECGLDQQVGDKQISDAAIVFTKIQPDEDVYINNILTCDTSVAPAPAPPGPPCAKWQDPGPESGVCEEVATSLPSGNISTNPGEFIVRIFTIILGLAGGIALLLFLSAGYKIIMSNGKPEGIQQGREQLISAIIGLVFIIFSFVIFQLVAVDILKIPGIK